MPAARGRDRWHICDGAGGGRNRCQGAVHHKHVLLFLRDDLCGEKCAERGRRRRFAMLNGLMEVAGRVGFAVPLTRIPFIGVWGIFLTTGLTWALTGIVSMGRYHKGKWEFKSTF